MSAHQLRIEPGRFSRNRIDCGLRLGTLCDKFDIEVEYHLVLVFPVYDFIREKVHSFVLLQKTECV